MSTSITTHKDQPTKARNQLLNDSLLALAIIAATAVFYLPALRGGFLWDDNTHISDNVTLRTLKGLREIWLNPAATCQYYPMSFTAFWAGYHLWGLNPMGYHLLNSLLHGIAAVLLWRVLARLRVKGALLAGAIFALHPVNVMSVAWMTELKNTLSGSLALASCWAYLCFSGLDAPTPGRIKDGNEADKEYTWSYYVLSLSFFLLAIFAKTAVSFLPATLFLIAWGKRKEITRRDVLPLLPMLGIALGMGCLTIYIEHHSGGASGREFNLGLLERILVSGRSFWFYLGKLVFPYHLTFIYERWRIDTGARWQYLYPLAAILTLTGLWLARTRIGKGAWVAAMHFYISTSMLILAVVLYMMRYSFVSDHWQYFGSMSMIGLMAAGMTGLWGRLGARAKPLGIKLAMGLLFGLGVLTWMQCGMYLNNETLWRTTVERNPNSWMPHDNLGNALLQNGKVDEAIEEHHQALKLYPDSAETYSNLANALLQNKQIKEAIASYKKSIEINPSNQTVHYNLGNLLLHETDLLDDAILHLKKCVEIESTLGIWPGNFYAHYDLGIALYKNGRIEEAAAHYERALDIQPDFAAAQSNLAWILATSPVASVRNGTRAVELALQADRLTAGSNPAVLRNLAAAYAEVGNFTDAVESAQRAYSMAIMRGDAGLSEALMAEIKLYKAGTPCRAIVHQ